MLFVIVMFVAMLQGLGGPRWQQLASRPLSLSAGLCGSETPPARADGTFKVTMVPGDGVGPELMTAVKDVFKVLLQGRRCKDKWNGVSLLTICLQNTQYAVHMGQ